MPDEANAPVVVSADAPGREYWLDRPFVSADLRKQIASAEILLVPQEGFRGESGPLFPVQTEDLLQFLKANAPTGLLVDIACDEDKYQELALHADWFVVAGAIAQYAGAPVLVGLVLEYLKRRFWPTDTKHGVKFKMTVQDERTGKAVGISFEGPAEDFEKCMKTSLGSLGIEASAAPKVLEGTPSAKQLASGPSTDPKLLANHLKQDPPDE